MKLSKRLGEVLELICEGLTNEQISQRLGISEETVKGYIRRLYSKLGVRGRAEASTWGRKNGFGKKVKALPFYKLSVIQMEALSYLAKAMSDAEIAEQLGITPSKARSRVAMAAAQLGEGNRIKIAAAFIQFRERYPDFSWQEAEKDPDKAIYWARLNGLDKELPSELPFHKLRWMELEVVQYFARGMTRTDMLTQIGFSKSTLRDRIRRIGICLGERNPYVIAHVYNNYGGQRV